MPGIELMNDESVIKYWSPRTVAGLMCEGKEFTGKEVREMNCVLWRGQHGYQLTRSTVCCFHSPAKRTSTLIQSIHHVSPICIRSSCLRSQVIAPASCNLSDHCIRIVSALYPHCIIRSSCLRADRRIFGSGDIALSLVCYTHNRIRHKK